MRSKPYYYMNSEELRVQLFRQAEGLNCPDWVFTLLNESFSGEWDPAEEFNGCSVVQDTYHPDLACYLHDFLWCTGRGGYLSDSIFLEAMKLQGLKGLKYKRRWIAVRAGWLFYYKWKHLKNDNIRPYTKGMKEFEEWLNK